MSTTSLKLPDDVKQLAIAAARHHGVTPHAFMVEAIRSAATDTERRSHFVADALAAEAEAIGTGKGYAAEEVHRYVQARARSESAAKPRAKTWRG